VLVNNRVMFDQLMEGTSEPRTWRPIKVDLSSFQDSTVTLRIYQRVLIPGRASGNAYWKNLRVQDRVVAATSHRETVLPSDSFLSPADVAIKGVLGKAIDLSERGRLRTLPGWDNGALITMFSTEARNKNTSTDWYGEHAGKWLYSAALAVTRTGNDTLKTLLLKTADYLVHNQEADGYLGSYSSELRLTNRNSKSHKKSWDLWSLSYMMLGMLEVNKHFPNDDYLNAAKRIGELVLKTFGDGSADVTNYGTRYGYSATVVLEPVVELYKVTSDQRYLDLAQLIVKEIERKEGLRMIAAALNNRDMETVADGKAYQIIWNLVGLTKLYEVTGTADYLTAVEHAWQNIHDYHLTITGGPWGGIGKHKECFNTKGFWDPYGFIETCSIMSWIQLNKLLLHLSGEAKYAQEIEKSAYNALLGAQLPNGQDWTYHSFTNGRKFAANYNDCCPSSGALALEELSSLLYTRKQDGFACNLYTENEATITLDNSNPVHISQRTGYPFSGNIRLTITPSKEARFPLFIRIPDWADHVQLTVGGKLVNTPDIHSGTYCTLIRDWKKGDVVDINFPLPLRMIQQSEFAVMPQGKEDIYKVNWMALARGPLVYASNGLINGRDRETNFHLLSEKADEFFKPVAVADKGDGQAYRFAAPGIKPLLFLPFYEAGGRAGGTWRLTWIQREID